MKRTKKEVFSIFRDILEEVKVSKTIEEAKSIILNRLEESRISVEDKFSIRQALNSKKTLDEVLFYIYNAVLAYEGCKVVKIEC